MKAFWTILANFVADVVIRIIKRWPGPTHLEGKSDGETEKKLQDKARKDGWNV